MKKTSAFIYALAFLPLVVMAHDGHGTTEGYTIIHYLIEPTHGFIAILVAGAAVIFFLRKKRKARA